MVVRREYGLSEIGSKRGILLERHEAHWQQISGRNHTSEGQQKEVRGEIRVLDGIEFFLSVLYARLDASKLYCDANNIF